CSKEPGFAEVLYRVDVPAGTSGKDLVATTAFADEVLDTYIYIRAACNDATTELTCHQDIIPGFDPGNDWRSLASLNNVAPGTYYVFVDTDQENGLGPGPAPCDFATACPSGSCECVAQTTHVAIYLRPLVGSGSTCDRAQLDNRCSDGLTCTGTGP